jgi:hypothetical protein
MSPRPRPPRHVALIRPVPRPPRDFGEGGGVAICSHTSYTAGCIACRGKLRRGDDQQPRRRPR